MYSFEGNFDLRSFRLVVGEVEWQSTSDNFLMLETPTHPSGIETMELMEQFPGNPDFIWVTRQFELASGTLLMIRFQK